MSGKGNKGNKKGNNNQEEKQDFKFDFAGKDAKQLTSQFDFSGKDAPLLGALQQRFNSLVGQSSGYLESLPKAVQERIKALKFLHKQRADLEKKFNQELAELEKKYDALYQPLTDRRSEIVTGVSEPKPEELVVTEQEGKTEEKPKAAEGKKEEENVKGIPEFWLYALKHHEDFGGMITEKDEAALKHLIDVRVASVPDQSSQSFTLEFHFSDNEFFDNKVLKKSYILKEEESGEVMYDHVESPDIAWKTGKNLTVKKVTKTQKKKAGRGRGGKGAQGPAQTVTVDQPVESFFHFFNPEGAYAAYNGGQVPDEEEEEEYGLQEFLEADYELGLELKEKIIPHAVMWFTGEEASIEQFDEEEEDEEDDDNEDENSEDDEEFQPPKENASGQQQNPECKQQ